MIKQNKAKVNKK